jgi:pyruvate formate lyase activating enzyme
MSADRIFFSGGEPTIHLPYIERVVFEARRLRPKLKVNFDTNGFMTEESLKRVLNFATSITFDLKAFYDDTMRAVTGVPVAPVLRNAEIVARHAKDQLWEFRIVVMPEINEDDIGPICSFLSSISEDLPVAFLSFRPNFVLDQHRGASKQLMARCLEQARDAGLKRATAAGVADIPGKGGFFSKELDAVAKLYERPGAALAASYASAKGCSTHPRDCGGCLSANKCPIKKYMPYRNC